MVAMQVIAGLLWALLVPWHLLWTSAIFMKTCSWHGKVWWRIGIYWNQGHPSISKAPVLDGNDLLMVMDGYKVNGHRSVIFWPALPPPNRVNITREECSWWSCGHHAAIWEPKTIRGGLQSNSSSFSFFFVVTIYEYLVSYSEEFSGDQWTPESNLHGLNYWAYPNYGSIWCTPALTNNSGTKWVCLKIGDPAFDGLSSCLLLKWPFCGLFPVSHDRPKFDQRPNSQYSSML